VRGSIVVAPTSTPMAASSTTNGLNTVPSLPHM
jgi:hypothetical protein